MRWNTVNRDRKKRGGNWGAHIGRRSACSELAGITSRRPHHVLPALLRQIPFYCTTATFLHSILQFCCWGGFNLAGFYWKEWLRGLSVPGHQVYAESLWEILVIKRPPLSFSLPLPLTRWLVLSTKAFQLFFHLLQEKLTESFQLFEILRRREGGKQAKSSIFSSPFYPLRLTRTLIWPCHGSFSPHPTVGLIQQSSSHFIHWF